MSGYKPRTPNGIAKKAYCTKLATDLIDELRALGKGNAAAFLDKLLREAFKK